MQKLLTSLAEHAPLAPLAVVIVGVVVFIIGAAGGLSISGLNLQVSDLTWRVALGVLGSIITVSGLLLFWLDASKNKAHLSRNKYGIRIKSPSRDHTEHSDAVKLVGGYKVKPPSQSLRLLIASEDKTQYWPHRIIEQFDEGEKEWFASASLEQPKSGEKYGVLIILALVGPTGKALWDYYYKIGQKHRVWEPLYPLPPDVIECDEVHVLKQS